MTDHLRFPRNQLLYEWQIECHRVRQQSWAVREWATLLRRQSAVVQEQHCTVRRRALRLL